MQQTRCILIDLDTHNVIWATCHKHFWYSILSQFSEQRTRKLAQTLYSSWFTVVWYWLLKSFLFRRCSTVFSSTLFSDFILSSIYNSAKEMPGASDVIPNHLTPHSALAIIMTPYLWTNGGNSFPAKQLKKIWNLSSSVLFDLQRVT